MYFIVQLCKLQQKQCIILCVNIFRIHHKPLWQTMSISSVACPQKSLNHVFTSDGFWQHSSVFWICQIVTDRELKTPLWCHNARWSLVRLLWPLPLSPFSSRLHYPITFNYWGENAQSTLATGCVNGIAGSPVGDLELASNRADMCGLWMTSSGARRELLSVRSFSRAELAPWSTNQFGEEGKINTGSPTWSQGGNIFLLVLIIRCLHERDANIKRRPFVSECFAIIAVWYIGHSRGVFL